MHGPSPAWLHVCINGLEDKLSAWDSRPLRRTSQALVYEPLHLHNWTACGSTDLRAHEEREQVSCLRRILQCQAAQRALRWVHRGLPQLFWHHLP